MTDKERLEEIPYNVKHPIPDNGYVQIKLEDYEWLYEKAKHVFMYEDSAEKANAVIEQTNEENIAFRKRVQELEKANKTLSDNHFQQIEQHKNLIQQNKRYREAIRKASDIATCCGLTAASILDEALEEME